LRKEIVTHLRGFEEIMSYGMPGYVVPHKIFRKDIVDPKLPLPFIGIASQRKLHFILSYGPIQRRIAGMVSESVVPLSIKKETDMGKCCVRFKKLMRFHLNSSEGSPKMTPKEWINIYVKNQEGNIVQSPPVRQAVQSSSSDLISR
jgi:hypothetical protein